MVLRRIGGGTTRGEEGEEEGAEEEEGEEEEGAEEGVGLGLVEESANHCCSCSKHLWDS